MFNKNHTKLDIPDPLPALASILPGLPIDAITLALQSPLSGSAAVAIIVAVLCLFCSGFISGSEIAYFSLTEQQLEDLEDEPGGDRIISLLAQPERLLATILIANNLVNVAIVILLNFALGPVFEGMSEILSFIIQTVLMTFLILLFGEILPKLYANYNILGWARMAAGGVKVMMKLFAPLSRLMVMSTPILKKVVSKREAGLTTDDLEQALEITSVATGDDKQMLEGILKFGDKTAVEIMTPRVDMEGLQFKDSFTTVLDTVVRTGYSRLPVMGDTDDDIRGILYARDLLPYIDLPDAERDAVDWHGLLREPYYVPEQRMIDDLLEDFRRRHIHLAIVVDEFGGTQGLVTLEDVLEEIVGDINDEYDEVEKTYRRLPDDTFIFEGRTELADFFHVTELDPEDYSAVTDDCETLAGMLLNIKGDFPKEKESIVYGRCRFLVLDIENHRITSVRVKVMPDVQADSKPAGT
ncbi:MAG: gliding motility-associated protein GldE [Muribaculaceae bacterium]|nr:gliding motility-associated protein GldE [Muribaculaceae bacterium]